MTRRCGADGDARAQRVFERSWSWIVGGCELVIGKMAVAAQQTCNKAYRDGWDHEDSTGVESAEIVVNAS
jgi:hypothetical protein